MKLIKRAQTFLVSFLRFSILCDVLNVYGYVTAISKHPPVKTSRSRSRPSYKNPAITIRGGGGGIKQQVLQHSAIQSLISKDTLVSFIGGSAAGAIGVGVSFPFDTVTTKYQLMSSSQTNNESRSIGMFELFRMIYADAGIGGFYGGVKGTMLGQGEL